MYLKRKIRRGKLVKMGEIKGLEIKPRKVDKIILCDNELTNKYIKKQLDKKFSKLYKKLYDFLISEDDTEAGVKACLGEMEKLKSVIFNKYQEFMKNKLYKEYLAKIVITENEFKAKYMEREYYSKIIKDAYKNMNNGFIEDMEKGRSR